MSDRFAYLYQPLERFDFARVIEHWSVHGVTVQNPATQQITYLSEEGDQIITSLSGLQAAVVGDNPHTFQLWFMVDGDISCRFRRTAGRRLVEEYSLVGLTKAERSRISNILVDRFEAYAMNTANLFLVIDFEGYTIELPWERLSVAGEYTDVICPDILGFRHNRFVDFKKCGYLRDRAAECGDYLIVRKTD